MKRKTRHQFYLPHSHTERLDRLAARPGASKTSVLTAALDLFFEHEGAIELDAHFGRRLDRQSRTAERIEQKVEALTELVGVFIHHHLSATSLQPAMSEEMSRLGQQRFQKLLAFVENRLAQGGTAARLAKPKSAKGDSHE
ncbi:CopG family transcriptional regulator [Novosphingobium sp. G106]|uniref:CopG family transcriptional regulator n=1 Tax=Novosphingobium sp. G106 TaxID=2849500 RepID=UPI001C2CD3A2|nr:CopG family transcriptional regulator [Novosphingobium sp. G106]MBV1690382.1 CopG family transcriptional regulator [Novosphingobium sp. G106]